MFTLTTLCACQIVMSGGTSASSGIFLGPPQQLLAFGDSVTAGAGADTPVFLNDYVGQVMSQYGWQQRNYAVGGTGIGDWAQFQHQVAARTISGQKTVALLGINDVFFAVQNTGSGSLDLTKWGYAAVANILYSAVIFADQIKANSGSWTRVGTWSAGSTGIATYDGYGIEQTSTIGDTASVTVTGTVVYLTYMANQPSGGVTFDVSIDNVSQGSFTNQGTVQAVPLENYQYYPMAQRFAGLGAGTHTLKVTYSSGSGALILVSANGNTLSNYPKFFVGNCIPEQGGVNASDQASLNTKLLTITSNLLADGLKVYYVDANSALDPNTDLLGVHPTQTGYNKLATKFESVIDANP